MGSTWWKIPEGRHQTIQSNLAGSNSWIRSPRCRAQMQRSHKRQTWIEKGLHLCIPSLSCCWHKDSLVLMSPCALFSKYLGLWAFVFMPLSPLYKSLKSLLKYKICWKCWTQRNNRMAVATCRGVRKMGKCPRCINFQLTKWIVLGSNVHMAVIANNTVCVFECCQESRS